MNTQGILQKSWTWLWRCHSRKMKFGTFVVHPIWTEYVKHDFALYNMPFMVSPRLLSSSFVKEEQKDSTMTFSIWPEFLITISIVILLIIYSLCYQMLQRPRSDSHHLKFTLQHLNWSLASQLPWRLYSVLSQRRSTSRIWPLLATTAMFLTLDSKVTAIECWVHAIME